MRVWGTAQLCRAVVFCLLSGTAISAAMAQSERIRPIAIDDLYRQADTVAVVKILSGDAQNYRIAVYKTVVSTEFKGAKHGDVLFVGTFVPLTVGGAYVLFLRKGQGVDPTGTEPVCYGHVPALYQSLCGGYSILPVEYSCVFDGEAAAQQCDAAVRLNPRQILLPVDWRTFPEGTAAELPRYEKWVRKARFMELLQTLRDGTYDARVVAH